MVPVQLTYLAPVRSKSPRHVQQSDKRVYVARCLFALPAESLLHHQFKERTSEQDRKEGHAEGPQKSEGRPIQRNVGRRKEVTQRQKTNWPWRILRGWELRSPFKYLTLTCWTDHGATRSRAASTSTVLSTLMYSYSDEVAG